MFIEIDQNGSVSKINTVHDGIKVIKTIFKMLKDYKPRKFYWRVAAIFAIVGLIIGMPVVIEFIKYRYVYKVPSAILATGIMIFAMIMANSGIVLDTVVKQNKERYELDLVKYQQIENLKSGK